MGGKLYLVQTVNDYYTIETHGIFNSYEHADSLAKDMSESDEENEFMTINIVQLDLKVDTRH